jgi:nitroreductase
METWEAITGRASVREYQPKPISKNLLEKIVDAARRAPTARAVEPWEFVVVADEKTLQDLGKLAENGPFLREAAACIAVFCQETKYYLEDGCAATENILLYARDLGIGSCWVAGDKKPYAANVANLLGVPENYKLVSLVSLGWPKSSIEQKKKRALQDVIHWEKF